MPCNRLSRPAKVTDCSPGSLSGCAVNCTRYMVFQLRSLLHSQHVFNKIQLQCLISDRCTFARMRGKLCKSVEQLHCLWQAALLTWWIGKLDSLLLIIDSMRLHTWGQSTALEQVSDITCRDCCCCSSCWMTSCRWSRSSSSGQWHCGHHSESRHANAHVSTANSIMLGSDWSVVTNNQCKYVF